MRQYIQDLGQYVYDTIHSRPGTLKDRSVSGISPGGDAQFDIDEVAEDAVIRFVSEGQHSIVLYSEDHGFKQFGESPEYLLVVDPIDGTRSAAAGLEMCCVSVAAARLSETPSIGDVEYALLVELKTGRRIYADAYSDGIESSGYDFPIPRLSSTTQLDQMFWSVEFNGHPVRLMSEAYGHLIDRSANTGGVFVFSSATYSISRIITGQLDAYVDIGNRILKDRPDTRAAFERVGNGRVLHLFPYDIAAGVFLAEKAGMSITDAYGDLLGKTLLTDLSSENQQSCVAASNIELHEKLLTNIDWRVGSPM